MTIRVLLADDHQLLRECLRSTLSADVEIEIVGEAENGRRAVELAYRLTPDVVVMDVSMPDLNGVGATRQVKARLPDIQVLALSAHSDPRFITSILAAGAAGYLLKDCAFDELCRAIHTVARKQVYLSPAIAGVVVESSLGLGSADGVEGSGAAALTPRLREVLQLLAEGLNTKQIAARLHLSAKTIETHRAALMKKLNCPSVAELTKYAIREGLISID
jgi:DNA-binding NarL/FixJ family response regulator